MSKVRNFAELAPNIGFSEFDFYDLYRSTFEKSELGRIKKLLPLHAMAENCGLVSKSQRQKLGRKAYLQKCPVFQRPPLGFVLFEKVPINQLFNKNQNAVSTDEYPNLFNMS